MAYKETGGKVALILELFMRQYFHTRSAPRYIYVYVCIYVYMYIYIHVYICIYMYIRNTCVCCHAETVIVWQPVKSADTCSFSACLETTDGDRREQ